MVETSQSLEDGNGDCKTGAYCSFYVLVKFCTGGFNESLDSLRCTKSCPTGKAYNCLFYTVTFQQCTSRCRSLQAITLSSPEISLPDPVGWWMRYLVASFDSLIWLESSFSLLSILSFYHQSGLPRRIRFSYWEILIRIHHVCLRIEIRMELAISIELGRNMRWDHSHVTPCTLTMSLAWPWDVPPCYAKLILSSRCYILRQIRWIVELDHSSA